MRFIFKVATVFVCSIILIAFLAACGVRTENDDKDSGISSNGESSKGETGETDAVISFESIGESSDSSSLSDNDSDVSLGDSSHTQNSTSSGGDSDNTDNSNGDGETSSSTESSKPGNGYEDPDSWTDPV